MHTYPLQTAALLFVVSLAGALLPLHRRWSDRWLHLFVAVSAGVFLGTVFLHLLPHLAGAEAGHAASDPHTGGVGPEPSLAPWLAALAGLLLLFVFEKVWLRSFTESAVPDPHRMLWAITWLGLGMHSLSEGVALAAILDQPTLRTQIFFSILVHKATEAFSLATVMRLARLGTGRSALFLGLFALLGPVGVLIGGELIGLGGSLGLILTGFACGTFLYVAVCDLLPEVFHHTDRPALKLAAVGAGVLVTGVSLSRLTVVTAFAGRVAQESLAIFLELAPYLLLGFLVAGILNQVIRPRWLTRHVSRESFRSTALASLIGAPLPLCSCSVVPVAVSMRKNGASKGATAAFLISTPETGVDSMAVSWALLGPFLTIARVIGAVVSAMFVGGFVSWFVRRGYDRPPATLRAADTPATVDTCCATSEPDPDPRPHREHAPHQTAPRGRLARIFHYAFVEMMDDLAASLVVGILISGLIAAVVPPSFFETPIAKGFPGMVLMLIVGIPIYVCASASTPIAAELIFKGMNPGAAFVFLLASPATNLGSLVVLSQQLGKRVVIVMVVALAAVTLALGWLVDVAYRALDLPPASSFARRAEHGEGWLGVTAAVVLGILLLTSIVRTRGVMHLFGQLPEEQPAA